MHETCLSALEDLPLPAGIDGLLPVGVPLHHEAEKVRTRQRVRCDRIHSNSDSDTLKCCTPYSMNRLFSEFFRKFGGAFLEVCETISRGILHVFRGKMKENYIEKNKEK